MYRLGVPFAAAEKLVLLLESALLLLLVGDLGLEG